MTQPKKNNSAPPAKKKKVDPHTPLEKAVLKAKIVRVTTLLGTSLTAPVSYIDRYNIQMGNFIIPKHSIEMYELEPELDDDRNEEEEI